MFSRPAAEPRVAFVRTRRVYAVLSDRARGGCGPPIRISSGGGGFFFFGTRLAFFSFHGAHCCGAARGVFFWFCGAGFVTSSFDLFTSSTSCFHWLVASPSSPFGLRTLLLTPTLRLDPRLDYGNACVARTVTHIRNGIRHKYFLSTRTSEVSQRFDNIRLTLLSLLTGDAN